jgi:hypothetical protein
MLAGYAGILTRDKTVATAELMKSNQRTCVAACIRPPLEGRVGASGALGRSRHTSE